VVASAAVGSVLSLVGKALEKGRVWGIATAAVSGVLLFTAVPLAVRDKYPDVVEGIFLASVVYVIAGTIEWPIKVAGAFLSGRRAARAESDRMLDMDHVLAELGEVERRVVRVFMLTNDSEDEDNVVAYLTGIGVGEGDVRHAVNRLHQVGLLHRPYVGMPTTYDIPWRHRETLKLLDEACAKTEFDLIASRRRRSGIPRLAERSDGPLDEVEDAA